MIVPVCGLMRTLPVGIEPKSEATQYTRCPDEPIEPTNIHQTKSCYILKHGN